MPEPDHDGTALPPVYARPAWCRDDDASQRWLPWDVKAVLDLLGTHHRYMRGVELCNRVGLGVGRGYPRIYQMEELGLLDSAWEDELFPEAWAKKGHTEDCDCSRGRYYSITPRGRLWRETYPARTRAPLWKRPGWWIGLILWAGFCAFMGFLIF